MPSPGITVIFFCTLIVLPVESRLFLSRKNWVATIDVPFESIVVNGACGAKPVHDKRKQRAYRGYQTTKPAKALATEQVPQANLFTLAGPPPLETLRDWRPVLPARE